MVDGAHPYSYRDLAEGSWRLANALRSAGLRKGDRVAALLFNSSAMREAHFAVPAAGGILEAINHRLASVEIGYIVGPDFCIRDPVDLVGASPLRRTRARGIPSGGASLRGIGLVR